MRTRTLLFLIVLTLAGSAQAQNSEKQWSFGPEFGVVEYAGDLSNYFCKFNTGYAVGASLYKYLNPSFDFGVGGFYDHVDKSDENNLYPGQNFNFSMQYYIFKASLKYKFVNG